MQNLQKGFAPALLLLVAAVVLVTVPVLGTTVTTKPTDNPSVKGVLIARGGDDSGGSSGGGDSGGGSHDSGGGGGSSGASSGSDNKLTTSPPPKLPERIREKNELEQPKVESKEVEIEDEVEKPEVEKVDVHLATEAGELEIETEGTRSGRRHATSSGISVASLKIKSGENSIEFESHGVIAGTNFPLTFDKTTGQLFVNTPNGPRLIRVLPDQASAIATTSGVQNKIEDIQLLENNGVLNFEVHGKKTGNFLGLFPVSADVISNIDPATGQITSVTQPRWLQLFGNLLQ